MEENQLDGGLTLVRMILNQPELRLVDLTDGHTLNRFIKEFDKRPIIKQIEQAVSFLQNQNSIIAVNKRGSYASVLLSAISIIFER